MSCALEIRVQNISLSIETKLYRNVICMYVYIITISLFIVKQLCSYIELLKRFWLADNLSSLSLRFLEYYYRDI